MTALADLKTAVQMSLAQVQNLQASAAAAVTQHESILSEIAAQEAAVPTLDDIRSMVDKMAVAAAKT